MKYGSPSDYGCDMIVWDFAVGAVADCQEWFVPIQSDNDLTVAAFAGIDFSELHDEY